MVMSKPTMQDKQDHSIPNLALKDHAAINRLLHNSYRTDKIAADTAAQSRLQPLQTTQQFNLNPNLNVRTSPQLALKRPRPAFSNSNELIQQLKWNPAFRTRIQENLIRNNALPGGNNPVVNPTMTNKAVANQNLTKRPDYVVTHAGVMAKEQEKIMHTQVTQQALSAHAPQAHPAQEMHPNMQSAQKSYKNQNEAASAVKETSELKAAPAPKPSWAAKADHKPGPNAQAQIEAHKIEQLKLQQELQENQTRYLDQQLSM